MKKSTLFVLLIAMQYNNTTHNQRKSKPTTAEYIFYAQNVVTKEMTERKRRSVGPDYEHNTRALLKLLRHVPPAERDKITGLQDFFSPKKDTVLPPKKKRRRPFDPTAFLSAS